jgi:hypothetical protein
MGLFLGSAVLISNLLQKCRNAKIFDAAETIVRRSPNLRMKRVGSTLFILKLGSPPDLAE